MADEKELAAATKVHARALASLWPAAQDLGAAIPRAEIAAACERELFRPAEDEALMAFFGRFLTVREDLWEVAIDAAARLGVDLALIDEWEERRLFFAGYAATCLIVQLDRLLIEEVAAHPVARRKLDEGSPDRRIPRKQFTVVFESFSDPAKALAMLLAMRWVRRHRHELKPLVYDAELGELWRRRRELEQALDPSRWRYLRLAFHQAAHSLQRRSDSAQRKTLFALLEAGGRFAAELHDRWREPRVPAKRQEIEKLLRPGDVLVTRRDYAFTNLFLPGYWPHAALFVGKAEDRERLGVALDEDRRRRWSGDRVVLEALKDGVRFRPLEQTLAVDAVVVLRPRLAEEELARAIERVVQHEGKGYNYDFDFFRADRLVCTAVVYRAFDGLGDLHFELQERAGRPTLAAEDLLRMALESRGFDLVAIYGAESCRDSLHQGEAVRGPLAASFDPGG
jgi:hypothetical protein